MDRLVDPMLHSIFNRFKTKLTNGLERTQSGYVGDLEQVVCLNLNQNLQDQSTTQIHQPSTFIPQPPTLSFNPTSSHFNPQFVNLNYSHQQQNGQNHLVSICNQQLSINHSQAKMIKEEIEPIEPTSQVQSSSYEPVSNEQHCKNNYECENSQISLSDAEIQTQPQQFAHIKHNQLEDKDECVDGGIEVKEEEDDEDDDEQMDEESSRPVERPRLDTTQPNNAIHIMQEVDCEHENGGQAMNTQFELHSQSTDTINSNLMVIQQEESDTNNTIEEESIASEYTTNPTQANLAQPNRQFQCSLCHKSFDRNFHLQTHLRVHTGERPFHCDQCGKRFKQKNDLTRHQLIHQNIKRFQCDQCDKQFTQKADLKRHLRTHSGERPHQCRFCEKTFARLHIRNSHEQAIHLHVKPYRCKLCGHTATERSHVIRHIRMVHFGLPKTIKQRALKIIDHRDPRELLEKV